MAQKTSLGHDKSDAVYTFASQPRRVQTRLEEEESSLMSYANLMYDKRVVRGNTYALSSKSHAGRWNSCRSHDAAIRKKTKRHPSRDGNKLQQQVEPPEGRGHAMMQTELYLEELAGRLEEFDIACQTDELLDRPSSPFFVYAKTGIDAQTQVYDGDLFNFDVEVVPIVEVLVGKTTEQSLLEVLEEEELANLRQQQRMFEELRNAEMAEHARLEEHDRRLREEKRMRIKRQQEMVARERTTSRKMAAHAFAHGFLADLVPSVYGMLFDAGYFFDPVVKEFEEIFMPWLTNESIRTLRCSTVAHTLLDELIRFSVVEHHADMDWLDTQTELVKEAHEDFINPARYESYPYFFKEDPLEEEEEEEEDEEEEES